MTRRQLLWRAALGLPAAALLAGHTPYRQWQVYRRRHLLIGTSREDPTGFELGRRIAALLDRELPESRARAARAPGVRRLASLLSTGQLPTALLPAAQAADLRAGRGAFADYGATDLRALFRFGDRWLVTPADFPAWQAYLLTATLAEHGTGLGGHTPAAAEAPVPVHPGAAAFVAGAPMPQPRD